MIVAVVCFLHILEAASVQRGLTSSTSTTTATTPSNASADDNILTTELEIVDVNFYACSLKCSSQIFENGGLKLGNCEMNCKAPRHNFCKMLFNNNVNIMNNSKGGSHQNTNVTNIDARFEGK